MQSVKAFISWEDNPPIEAFLKMDPRSGTLQLPAMVFSCCGARKKVFSLAPSTAEAREIHRRVEAVPSIEILHKKRKQRFRVWAVSEYSSLVALLQAVGLLAKRSEDSPEIALQHPSQHQLRRRGKTPQSQRSEAQGLQEHAGDDANGMSAAQHTQESKGNVPKPLPGAPFGSQSSAFGACSAVDKDSKTRWSVYNELMASEERFVNQLRIVVDHVVRPLQQAAVTSDIGCSIESIASCFGNLEELLDVNSELLGAMDRCRSTVKRLSEHLPLVFVDLAPKLFAYAEYCKGYIVAHQRLDSLVRESRKFARALTNCLGNAAAALNEKGMAPLLDIFSFLITPVQRLCRYPLLWKRVQEHTSDAHPNRSVINEALVAVENVAAKVNDSMEHQEQLLRVMRVFAQFGDQASDNILVPDRRVVMELLPSDVTMYYFSGEEVTVALFLFSDSLVIGTPKEGHRHDKPAAVQSSILPAKQNKYKLLTSIDLTHISARPRGVGAVRRSIGGDVTDLTLRKGDLRAAQSQQAAPAANLLAEAEPVQNENELEMLVVGAEKGDTRVDKLMFRFKTPKLRKTFVSNFTEAKKQWQQRCTEIEKRRRRLLGGTRAWKRNSDMSRPSNLLSLKNRLKNRFGPKPIPEEEEKGHDASESSGEGSDAEDPSLPMPHQGTPTPHNSTKRIPSADPSDVDIDLGPPAGLQQPRPDGGGRGGNSKALLSPSIGYTSDPTSHPVLARQRRSANSSHLRQPATAQGPSPSKPHAKGKAKHKAKKPK